MKGYKAFGKGMVCRGKQYAENTVFEEKSAEICQSGMHFCKNPLDVLDHYPLVDENGDISEFAEVEALDDAETNDGKKYVTKKLKVGARLTFADLVKASLSIEHEECAKLNTTDKDGARIGSSGYDAKIGSSGDDARIGSSGNCAQIASSGYDAQIGSSGYDAKIASSGNCAQIASSGNCAQIGSSGNCAKIGSSGDDVRIDSSGDYAKIGSSGRNARIGSSGNCAKIGSSGDDARIGSSGNCAQIASSGRNARIGSLGYDAQIGSSGRNARIGSSGNCAQIASSGKDCIICCAGDRSCVKAKIGSWITLSEWKYDDEKIRNVPVCVKTEQVDGERIKEDVFYTLRNGEFVEVTE